MDAGQCSAAGGNCLWGAPASGPAAAASVCSYSVVALEAAAQKATLCPKSLLLVGGCSFR